VHAHGRGGGGLLDEEFVAACGGAPGDVTEGVAGLVFAQGEELIAGAGAARGGLAAVAGAERAVDEAVGEREEAWADDDFAGLLEEEGFLDDAEREGGGEVRARGGTLGGGP
jgi:hypothetical protein